MLATSTKRHILTLFLITVSFCISPVMAATNGLQDAEQIAVKYMAAFMRGDIRAAAQLTHPDVQIQLRRAVLDQLDKAKSEGKEHDALISLGFTEQPQQVRQMSPQELYVRVIEHDRKIDAKTLEMMKRTSVVSAGSESLGGGRAKVILAITSPAKTGSYTQQTTLVLRAVGSEWAVTNEAP